jgi:hypothetical protein
MKWPSWIQRKEPPRNPPPRASSERIAAWLRERTFHHSHFADIGKLVAAKQRQSLKISLLPAGVK